MKQLGLFKQRGARLPPPKEFASHCVVAALLRRWCHPAWRYTHIPLGEHRSIATGRKLQRMGVVAGWPDFQFCGPGRQMFFLELKRRGSGRLSVEQADIVSHIAACGFNILVTDSVDDAIATLKQLGILRTTVAEVI